MKDKKDKIYITASIAYVNGAPHIGYALECVQADAIARWKRRNGADVFFSTGTDEHGAKIAKTAKNLGKTIKELVDENAQKFIDLTKTLNLSNNTFIRTSDQNRHWPAVQKIWKILYEKGDIYLDKYKGLYCVGCEAYITEKELVDGKCPIHKTEPEVLEEENYFFDLKKYKDKLKEFIKNGDIGFTPEHRRKEVLNMIDGMENISVSRPKNLLPWGVPVPNDESQTIYVWFEALINYLSALGYGTDEENFNKFWEGENLGIIHFIGKDILKFHAIVWPAMLLAADLSLPNEIFVHGYITANGEKMSKSLGNVVDPFTLVEKYGVDAVRYYLLSDIPATEDGDYTEERFNVKYTADLVNGIGNLVSRVTNIAEKNFGGSVKNNEDNFLEKPIEKFVNDFYIDLTELKISEAVGDFTKIMLYLDGGLSASEPWKLIKEDRKKTEEIIFNSLESIRILSHMIYPFMPETSEKIFEKLGLDAKTESAKTFDEATRWGGVEFKNVKKGEGLFLRIK